MIPSDEQSEQVNRFLLKKERMQMMTYIFFLEMHSNGCALSQESYPGDRSISVLLAPAAQEGWWLCSVLLEVCGSFVESMDTYTNPYKSFICPGSCLAITRQQ